MTASWSFDVRPRTGDPLLPGAAPAAIRDALLPEDRAAFEAAYQQAVTRCTGSPRVLGARIDVDRLAQRLRTPGSTWAGRARPSAAPTAAPHPPLPALQPLLGRLQRPPIDIGAVRRGHPRHLPLASLPARAHDEG